MNSIDQAVHAQAVLTDTSCLTTVYRYTYDGDGNLVKRARFTGSLLTLQPAESTVYIGGIYEATGSTITKYYSFGGRRIAMRQGSTTTYLHADHLGSASVMTNGSGSFVGRVQYWPFGATRAQSGTVATDKLYTGQQKEPESALGMYHYGARMYSTVLGRFLSVDPVAAGGPQGLNPYAYAWNNPLKFVDPWGLTPECFMFCTGSPEQLILHEDDSGNQVIYPQSQGRTAAEPVTCDASCQSMQAVASVGWTYEQWAYILAAATQCEACEGLTALAQAGQEVDYYTDLLGGESADSGVYQPHDLVSDISPLTDLKTLFDPSLSPQLDERTLALLFLAVPGPGSGAKKASNQLDGLLAEGALDGWRVVSSSVEPATKRAWRKGHVSIVETLENVESGERVVRHSVTNGVEYVHRHIRLPSIVPEFP